MAASMQAVTVLGAGVLGGQIAWQSAFKGKRVVVYDLYPESIEKCREAHRDYAGIFLDEDRADAAALEATGARIGFSTALPEAVTGADVVIEAVPEIPDVKRSVYREMAPHLAPRAIVATNSSTLLPRAFAADTGRPERYCAMHFATRVWDANIAEIMGHPGTSLETLQAITRLAIEIGMIPIPVAKEQNGYLLNSWLVPLLNAAQSLVTHGVGAPEQVDRSFLIMNPGARIGPFGILDLVGLKTAYDILAYWGNENGDAAMLENAAYVKANFLDKGKLGALSGEGYYTYPDPAYASADFLAVPPLEDADRLARMALQR